ncbi:MAG: TetR/AcrR family transcriptional regulator C-terminal domain-containing protein [Oscillospiraceae bacterium]
MEKSTDRRVRKTLQILRGGLTSLMKEKPINEISVRELSELCDINRGTFYLHYKDVFDMVEQLERELYRELEAILAKYDIHSDEQMLLMMKDLFAFLDENKDICSAILGKYGNSAFVMRVATLMKAKYNYLWNSLKGNKSTTYERSFWFMVSGAIGLIQEWLGCENPEPADEIAELAYQLIFNGIKMLTWQ